jgi:hypothetical protein
MRQSVSWARVARAALVFAVALVAFDRALYWGIGALQARVMRGTELRHMLEAVERKQDYEWLVLGTSRTYEAIHPSAIERAFGVKAFKSAGRGKGPRYQYEFYRLYAPMFGPPRVLLLGIDAFMFGIDSDDPYLRRLEREASPGAQAPLFWPPLRLAAHRREATSAVLRILERLQFELTPDDPQFSVELMQAYAGTVPARPPEQAEPGSYVRVPHDRFPGVEGEYFRKLIAACAADGVTVVLIYPPDVVGTQRTHQDHAAFIDEIRGLVASCPSCLVLDYGNTPRFPSTEATYFIDGGYGVANSHLSKAGAEAFAALWVPDVKRILDQAGTNRRPSIRQPPSSTR